MPSNVLWLMGLCALIALLLPSVACGADPGNRAMNVTLQNERIAVYGSSWASGCYGSCLANIVGREVESTILPDTGVVGALSEWARYNETRFGIIVTSFGGNDWWPQGRPWEDVEGDFRQLLRNLKSSGAVVVYNQLVPESIGYPTGQVCQEEGVVLVPEITEGIGLPMDLNPRFYDGDAVHPSLEGYCLMAERTAMVLVDVGLIPSAMTCEELSESMPAVFSHARELIEAVKAKGADTQLAMKHFSTAEYLRDHNLCYTANWSLQRRITGPFESFLERWDEVPDMDEYFAGLFDEANLSIRMIEEKGLSREVILLEADYFRAEKAWIEHDYDAAKLYLEKIITRCLEIPEATLLAFLGPGLLPLLLRRRWESMRAGTVRSMACHSWGHVSVNRLEADPPTGVRRAVMALAS